MKNWFVNLVIRKKVVYTSSLSLIFVLLIAVFGIVFTNKTASDGIKVGNDATAFLEKAQNMQKSFSDADSALRGSILSEDLRERLAYKQESEDNIAAFRVSIDEYLSFLEQSTADTTEEAAALTDIKALLDKYVPLASSLNAAENLAQAASEYNSKIKSIYIEISDKLEWIFEHDVNRSIAEINNNVDTSNFYSTFLVIFTICSAILIYSLLMTMRISISSPLVAMNNVAKKMAVGDFSQFNDYVSNDEIGQLSDSFNTVARTINNLINDLSSLSTNHKNGEIDTRISEDVYVGSFRLVAEGINQMTDDYINADRLVMDCVKQFGNGNFNAELMTFPGKKKYINDAIEGVRVQLKSVADDIGRLVSHAARGSLDERINTEHYSGDWANLTGKANHLVETVVTPLKEMAEVIHNVSRGKLDVKVEGYYNGEFKKIKYELNNMIEVLSGYISEISHVLNEISSNNLKLYIHKSYNGEFIGIKDSLTTIITKLNEFMTEINESSQNVLSSSEMISQTSSHLADNANRQVGTIENMKSTILTIAEMTNQNAESAQEANKRVVDTKVKADASNELMHKMLKSMDEINDASQNIYKINKAIGDIAFQTNLLALNAAVEAARAGEHGKGFAVVAEEVRNLASRSQQSAEETEKLMDISSAKVSEGVEFAKATAESLNEIMSNVSSVSEMINLIAHKTEKQSNDINQLSDSVTIFSESILENSASAEESAASAEGLSGQSSMLDSMVKRFTLMDSD